VATQVAEIIDVQDLGGQQVLNVYHYVDTSGALTVATLLTAFETDVLPKETAFQEASIVHNSLRYRIVTGSPSLMQEKFITPQPGQAASSGYFTPETAFSFKFGLPLPTVILAGGFTGHIKRGGCRIAGIPKGAIVSNVVASGNLAVCATWATSLIAPSGGGWVLCVASFLNGARARQHAVQAYAVVGSVSAPGASTQNTRKVLRGRTF
jgi:hypothetical protein